MKIWTRLAKILKSNILLLFLQHRFSQALKKEKLVFPSTAAPTSPLNFQVIITSPNLPSVGTVDFNDISQVDAYIQRINFKINELANKKKAAMSLTEFYNLGKLIRVEQNKLKHALVIYKNLEIKNNLPVNLIYRSALKRLSR